MEVSWEGVTPQEKLSVPLFELELASGSPASQAEEKSFPQGRSGLQLAGPCSSCPGLRNWREPTEGHPFKPVPGPGTLPSVPDSRAMSSATRRLTTACQSTAAPAWHRPMCLSSSCLCSSPLPLRTSIAAQHITPSAHHTHDFLVLPAINSHLPPHSLHSGHRAFCGSQDGLLPPPPPCICACFLCLEYPPTLICM